MVRDLLSGRYDPTRRFVEVAEGEGTPLPEADCGGGFPPENTLTDAELESRRQFLLRAQSFRSLTQGSAGAFCHDGGNAARGPRTLTADERLAALAAQLPVKWLGYFV